MKRKYYWAWPSHLNDGKMALIEPKRWRKGMVRVEVRLAPKRRKTK